MTLRTCTGCGESKPPEAFTKRRHSGGKLVPSWRCKECVNEEVKEASRDKTFARWIARLPERTVRNLKSEHGFLRAKLNALRAEWFRRK